MKKSSILLYGLIELFGCTQIFDNFKSRTTSSSKFQIKFLYKIVWHPIMFGFTIVCWVTPETIVGHLLFAIITTAYISIAVKYLEEKDLREVLDLAYEMYQQKVPLIVPFLTR